MLSRLLRIEFPCSEPMERDWWKISMTQCCLGKGGREVARQTVTDVLQDLTGQILLQL